MASPDVLANFEKAPPLASRHELTVTEVLAQAEKIHQAMTRAMEEGIHFGKIPGTPKPTLFKAGAEKLCLLFRMDPQYASTDTTLEGDHLTVKSKCTLWHIPTGQRLGSGEGSCSTRESKYAYRKREGRRVPNPDLADQWNIVLKMANKRALVAAVLNVTGTSDVFSQDLEDEEELPKAPTKRADHTETDPDSGREEMPAGPPPVPPKLVAAAFSEWMDAFTKPTTAKALEALWRGVTMPDLWNTFTADQQVQLTAAKNAGKKRLGVD